MAMNKKEQAEMAALRRELAVARAFRRTEKIEPDLAPPKSSGQETSGYVFNSYDSSVSQAWSSLSCHGIGYASRAKSHGASQNSCWLYGTELLALKALRWEVEEKMVNKLADIDIRIQALIAGAK